jgi:hypothetical protein
MKGVGRRGGICPLCFDTFRNVWKVGEATWPRRRRAAYAAVCTRAPPLVTGPVDARRRKKGVYLIVRAAEAVSAVLRTAAR